MMRLIVVIVMLFLSLHQVFGQVDSVLARSWSLSVGAHEYGYDTGLGGELGSPSIINGRVCLRLKASAVWSGSYWAVHDRWVRYGLVEVMAVYQFRAIQRAKPYIEAGLINVFPSQKFSDIVSIQGLGLRTGAELFVFMNDRLHVVYYFGGGLNSVNAIAEKMEAPSSYADGFTFTTGFRLYLPGRQVSISR